MLEIVAFAPPARVTFRGEARLVSFTDEISLAAGDGGSTILRATMRARGRGWWRLLEPLIGATMRQQFGANWPHLKRVLEAAAPARRDATAAQGPGRANV